jgi:hypothetical protein
LATNTPQRRVRLRVHIVVWATVAVALAAFGLGAGRWMPYALPAGENVSADQNEPAHESLGCPDIPIEAYAGEEITEEEWRTAVDAYLACMERLSATATETGLGDQTLLDRQRRAEEELAALTAANASELADVVALVDALLADVPLADAGLEGDPTGTSSGGLADAQLGDGSTDGVSGGTQADRERQKERMRAAIALITGVIEGHDADIYQLKLDLDRLEATIQVEAPKIAADRDLVQRIRDDFDRKLRSLKAQRVSLNTAVGPPKNLEADIKAFERLVAGEDARIRALQNKLNDFGRQRGKLQAEILEHRKQIEKLKVQRARVNAGLDPVTGNPVAPPLNETIPD